MDKRIVIAAPPCAAAPAAASAGVKRSFAPVGAGPAHARLLVLGSLPGEASLAAGRYYAHPRNQFWTLLGAALDEPLAALDYDARLARLATRGLALWDVVGEGRRAGSLDGAIREAALNPLAQWVAAAPHLSAIAFNGATAARLGRRALGGIATTLIDLPSSSPAYTLALADKAARWTVLGPLALPRESGRMGR